ncbi:MAG: hypothetical protein Q4F24_07930 [Eubacteriales bacterium]|nr:hypothetical protein [Eubacteriales bacterium]
MERVQKLEIENQVLRETLEKIRKVIKESPESTGYSYTVSHIENLLDEQAIKTEIEYRIWKKDWKMFCTKMNRSQAAAAAQEHVNEETLSSGLL